VGADRLLALYISTPLPVQAFDGDGGVCIQPTIRGYALFRFGCDGLIHPDKRLASFAGSSA
jgi:hypothetical protein